MASCIVRGRLYKVPTTHLCNFCMCPMYSAAFEFDCNIFCTSYPQAVLAQLVERPHWNDKDEGSNPSAVAIFALTRCMLYYPP